MTKEEYTNNIQILNVKLMDTSWGEAISIKIIDNNKKYFKKKKLYMEYAVIKNIDSCIKSTINYYVWDNYSRFYRQEELNEMLKEWKEKEHEY